MDTLADQKRMGPWHSGVPATVAKVEAERYRVETGPFSPRQSFITHSVPLPFQSTLLTRESLKEPQLPDQPCPNSRTSDPWQVKSSVLFLSDLAPSCSLHGTPDRVEGMRVFP